MTRTQCPFDIELHRKIWEQGYRAAEKDNVLTWQDISRIKDLLKDVNYEARHAGCYDDIPWYKGTFRSEYEEVLKRFNKQRNESKI